MYLNPSSKADPAPEHRVRATLFENFLRVYFDCRTRNLNQHAVFTMLILFSTLTAKHRVCIKGHQNNLKTSEIIPRRDRAPPGSKINGSATDLYISNDVKPVILVKSK